VKTLFVFVLLVALLATLFWWRFSIFVVQPIGAVPEGRTLVINRLNRDAVRFVDSADGICHREMGGVSLLCRGVVMAGVLDEATIVMRLPYMDWLYKVSTGGRAYER
jgi:hypothetical protein